mgnify:CR=1 FL=1
MFMYLPFQNVHTPQQAPESYINQYKSIQNMQRRVLAGMIMYLSNQTWKHVAEEFCFHLHFFAHFTFFWPINVHTRHTCNWVSTVVAYFLCLKYVVANCLLLLHSIFRFWILIHSFTEIRHQVVVFYVTVNIFFSSDCHIRWGSR